MPTFLYHRFFLDVLMTNARFLLLCSLLIVPDATFGFQAQHSQRRSSNRRIAHDKREILYLSQKKKNSMRMMALGDYTLELEKPLGMILEELDDGGVYVKEVIPNGAAARSNQIVPRDVLLKVDDMDVSTMDFDSVMNLFASSGLPNVRVTLGDGLGMMDMPKNVVNQLKSQEDAFFIDSVVRQAVREIRKDGRLGDVLKVEVIVGAGVQQQQNKNAIRGMVRFFAIFSTDGVSTYSCNVAATGIRQHGDENEGIEIVSLSCAKDEGLGRTYDLIQEKV